MIDGSENNYQLTDMPTTTEESPVIPGLEKETPEQQVRENLERAMFKYRGNLQLYLEKLMERVPEPADDSVPIGIVAQNIVRRRTHQQH